MSEKAQNNPQSPDDRLRSQEEAAYNLRVQRRLSASVRFVCETALLLMLMALLWYAFHLDDIAGLKYDYREKYVAALWMKFLIYSSVFVTLLTMIFYGTSFETTPFQLLMPFMRRRAKGLGELFELSNESAAVPSKVVSRQPEQVEPLTDEEQIAEEVPDIANVQSPAAQTTEPARHSGENMAAASEGTIDRILRHAASDSVILAEKMQNRINLHLSFGVLTGGVGLVVWYMTFYHTEQKAPDPSLSGRLFDALPRITILFFIELLAGFFLRQYRIGVEDLKYFLELRRRADSKRIAYSILERVADKAAIIAFANQLLTERSDSHLAAGETTTSLYAMEKEKNEILAGMEMAVQVFKESAKKMENVSGKIKQLPGQKKPSMVKAQ